MLEEKNICAGKILAPSSSALTKVLFRSSYLCGVDIQDTGAQLPKICCPSAALAASAPPPAKQKQEGEGEGEGTGEEEEEEDRYSGHPGTRLVAARDSCGVSRPDMRIVGGQDAPIGKFPWLVNLGYQQRGAGEKVFKCGGSLIGPRHIVTAAHCVTQLPRGFELTTIRVGEHDLDTELDCDTCPPAQDIAVEDVIFHPSYGKPEAFQNDIAVVKLAHNVTENEFVVPICLPWADDAENYVDGARAGAGAALTEVAGWGATTITGRRPASVLQVLDVAVTDSAECRDIYKERGGVLGDSQICAGGTKGKVCIKSAQVAALTGMLRTRVWGTAAAG